MHDYLVNRVTGALLFLVISIANIMTRFLVRCRAFFGINCFVE